MDSRRTSVPWLIIALLNVRLSQSQLPAKRELLFLKGRFWGFENATSMAYNTSVSLASGNASLFLCSTLCNSKPQEILSFFFERFQFHWNWAIALVAEKERPTILFI
jgi:hypothetical protein